MVRIKGLFSEGAWRQHLHMLGFHRIIMIIIPDHDTVGAGWKHRFYSAGRPGQKIAYCLLLSPTLDYFSVVFHGDYAKMTRKMKTRLGVQPRRILLVS